MCAIRSKTNKLAPHRFQWLGLLAMLLTSCGAEECEPLYSSATCGLKTLLELAEDAQNRDGGVVVGTLVGEGIEVAPTVSEGIALEDVHQAYGGVAYELQVDDALGSGLPSALVLTSFNGHTYWSTKDGTPYPGICSEPEPATCIDENHQVLNDSLLGERRAYFVMGDRGDGQTGLRWHAALDDDVVRANGTRGEAVSLAELAALQQ